MVLISGRVECVVQKIIPQSRNSGLLALWNELLVQLHRVGRRSLWILLTLEGSTAAVWERGEHHWSLQPQRSWSSGKSRRGAYKFPSSVLDPCALLWFCCGLCGAVRSTSLAASSKPTGRTSGCAPTLGFPACFLARSSLGHLQTSSLEGKGSLCVLFLLFSFTAFRR